MELALREGEEKVDVSERRKGKVGADSRLRTVQAGAHNAASPSVSLQGNDPRAGHHQIPIFRNIANSSHIRRQSYIKSTKEKH